jgi:hypothetical protein
LTFKVRGGRKTVSNGEAARLERSEARGQIAEVNPLASGFHFCNLTSDLCNLSVNYA